jgi:hypothetical protein
MSRVFVIAMLLIAGVSLTVAQAPKHTGIFNVKGSALDGKGNPFAFAWVCLKDTHSHILRMKRAGRDGRFAFTMLSARFDYEVYAEQDDLTTEKVLISGPEKAPEVVITLKVKRNQEHH